MPHFWKLFTELPAQTQELAFQKYALFRKDPYHPSLSFQSKGDAWTVEIGRSCRAIAYRFENHSIWFWIGSHEDYNHILRRVK